jgi:hypothetical protein
MFRLKSPPDVVELREAVVEEMMFRVLSDTARMKNLHTLSDDLPEKELSKQIKTKLAILKKRNITTSVKIDLLLNQITF